MSICIYIVHREFVFCKRYIVPLLSSARVTSQSAKTLMKECIRTSIHGAMEQINWPRRPLLVLHRAMLLLNVRLVCKQRHVSYNPPCPPPHTPVLRWLRVTWNRRLRCLPKFPIPSNPSSPIETLCRRPSVVQVFRPTSPTLSRPLRRPPPSSPLPYPHFPVVVTNIV